MHGGLPAAPDETDDRLEASLRRALGRSLVSNEVAIYDARFGFDGIDHRYEVTGADSEVVRTALAIVELALAPAGNAVAVKELTRLGMMTKARAEDVGTLEARLVVFAEELATYPEDVVIDACRYWGRAEKFFPSWSELKDLLDRRVKRRQRMRDALARARA